MLNIKRLFITSCLFSIFFTVEVFSQKINKTNTKGERTGVWKKYYENGSLRYSGEFINGKEKGTFKFYKKSASFPHIVKEYSATSDTAYVKFYTRLGVLKSKGKMIGKKREGQWVYYFANKKVLSEEFYKNGKLDGLLKNFYPNGKTTNETYYKNGLRHGNSKTYTDDGILIEEVNYTEDKLDGLAKFYDLKGVIKEKGEYALGKKVGKWEFYIDGEVSEKPKRRSYSSDKE